MGLGAGGAAPGELMVQTFSTGAAVIGCQPKAGTFGSVVVAGPAPSGWGVDGKTSEGESSMVASSIAGVGAGSGGASGSGWDVDGKSSEGESSMVASSIAGAGAGSGGASGSG